jgi:hypothetical protein
MNHHTPLWIALSSLLVALSWGCQGEGDGRPEGGEVLVAGGSGGSEENTDPDELALRVLDVAGAPVASGHVLYGVDSALGEATPFAAGRAVLRAAELPLVVVVCAPGYHEVVLTGVSSDRDVVLPPGIPLELRLPPDAVVPAGWELRARWTEDRLDELLPSSESPAYAAFDRAGVARLTAPRAGLLALRVEACRVEDGSRVIRIALPVEDRLLEVSALPERRVIELHLTSAALAHQLDG